MVLIQKTEILILTQIIMIFMIGYDLNINFFPKGFLWKNIIINLNYHKNQRQKDF